MSKQKRALASSSSGQPSQPKRPCVAPIDPPWNGSEANLVRCCCLTEECMQSVCTQVLERVKSDLAESIQSCLWNALKDILPQMLTENFSQILKEAVESAYGHSLHIGRSDAKSIANNGARNLQLRLLTKLSLPVFTGKEIEGEEGAPINIALIDANTGEIVTSGPQSSIKLDVVVLEGDFNKDNEDNWAPEEFLNYVVKERKGKRPLLTGELTVKLKEGVGELGKMIFTDNSSWNRSKTFRIGLKVASGFCGDTRIREAITDPFPVKEHRGEAYKKHHPPASDDEVWRLENIAKDGKSHQKLSEAGMHKVEDFLLQLFTDPRKLRGILGKSITEKKWDILVSHAKTCKARWKLYLDYPDGMTKHGAVFNTEGQLIGLIQDTEYFATHQFSAQQKELGDTIVKKALANWNDMREFSSQTFSDSVQKNSSSTFFSQVGGQIENVNPVRRCLAPPVFAAPVGPEAPLANVNSTAEAMRSRTQKLPLPSSTHKGLTGAMALIRPVQSQYNNSGNSIGISVDENFHLAAPQPRSADHLIPPGYHGRTAAGWPTLSDGINLQDAMHRQMIDSLSQMDYTGYGNVHPSEPSYASISSFQSTRILNEGYHGMEDLQSINWAEIFPDSPPFKGTFDNGNAMGASRGVVGWLKIKAVFQWGFFIRKKVAKIEELHQTPVKVQACS